MILLVLKSAHARKAGKVDRNLVVQAPVPSRIYPSWGPFSLTSLDALKSGTPLYM